MTVVLCVEGGKFAVFYCYWDFEFEFGLGLWIDERRWGEAEVGKVFVVH